MDKTKEWVEALQQTFKEDVDKVQIIHRVMKNLLYWELKGFLRSVRT